MCVRMFKCLYACMLLHAHAALAVTPGVSPIRACMLRPCPKAGQRNRCACLPGRYILLMLGVSSSGSSWSWLCSEEAPWAPASRRLCSPEGPGSCLSSLGLWELSELCGTAQQREQSQYEQCGRYGNALQILGRSIEDPRKNVPQNLEDLLRNNMIHCVNSSSSCYFLETSSPFNSSKMQLILP